MRNDPVDSLDAPCWNLRVLDRPSRIRVPRKDDDITIPDNGWRMRTGRFAVVSQIHSLYPHGERMKPKRFAKRGDLFPVSTAGSRNRSSCLLGVHRRRQSVSSHHGAACASIHEGKNTVFRSNSSLCPGWILCIAPSRPSAATCFDSRLVAPVKRHSVGTTHAVGDIRTDDNHCFHDCAPPGPNDLPLNRAAAVAGGQG